MRTQVRSKTPRVETSVVIANQHPQLPKKLNFVFAVVARMPPLPAPHQTKLASSDLFFCSSGFANQLCIGRGGGKKVAKLSFLGSGSLFW